MRGADYLWAIPPTALWIAHFFFPRQSKLSRSTTPRPGRTPISAPAPLSATASKRGMGTDRQEVSRAVTASPVAPVAVSSRRRV